MSADTCTRCGVVGDVDGTYWVDKYGDKVPDAAPERDQEMEVRVCPNCSDQWSYRV